MISFKRSAAFVLIFSLSFFGLRAQPSTSGSETLFTVNKKPVTTDEFIYLYKKNHQHKPEEFTREKIEEYLNLFINYKLKVEEARLRGMDTTATFKKEFQTYRDELLKPYMPDSRLVDSLVQLTYDRLKEEVNASHILIRVSPDAAPQDTVEAYRRISDLRNRAIAGEDFATLAASYSEEPGADATRGNLGYFTAMQMVFPFEQAAYLTPPGGVSNPVRTQFGYHLVKVHDRQPSRGEVEVSHIMIRTQEGVEDLQARDKIFDIHDQLQKGVAWEELCKQYSEDPASRDNGGKLRPFGVGAMASVPAFQEMAFSLKEPGDISDPVQTQFGWHILRLESKIPLPSFEDLKPALTQRVSRDERVTISKQALRDRMRKEFDYVANENTKAKLPDEDLLAGENSESLQSLQEEVLFTMQNRAYRVNDFLQFVKAEKKIHTIPSSGQKTAQLLDQYVERIQLGLLEAKVARESPDYQWLLKEYYEGILLFEIMEKEVWNRAVEDTTGQRSYFAQHRHRYTADERMVGKIYHTPAKGRLEELRTMLKDDRDNIAGFLALHKIRLDSGAFQKKDRTIFSRIAWSPGVHLTDHNGVHYLVEIEKLVPPGPQTFEEARPSVISDYQTFLEDSWITELKRKFVVKVEKKAKKRAFDQLINHKR